MTFSISIRLLKWPPRYSWTIVENGVKHHQTNIPAIIPRSILTIDWVSGWYRDIGIIHWLIYKRPWIILYLMHALFPRPISTPRLKPSGRYRSLGVITVLIRKRTCINLLLMHTLFHIRTVMHALFHIRIVIIAKDRYRPEGFSPRVDIAVEGW